MKNGNGSRSPASRPRRRRIVIGAALALSGCGFAFKRPPELSFQTIQLAGFAPRSPLAVELRTHLEASPTTRVVDTAGQVILQALSESREKVVVAPILASFLLLGFFPKPVLDLVNPAVDRTLSIVGVTDPTPTNASGSAQ